MQGSDQRIGFIRVVGSGQKGALDVVQRVIDWVFKRERQEPDIPECPSHHVPMQLRGLMGDPARFSYQRHETYTAIYYCPTQGCDETATVSMERTQIPVPGAAPDRPRYARR